MILHTTQIRYLLTDRGTTDRLLAGRPAPMLEARALTDEGEVVDVDLCVQPRTMSGVG